MIDENLEEKLLKGLYNRIPQILRSGRDVPSPFSELSFLHLKGYIVLFEFNG